MYVCSYSGTTKAHVGLNEFTVKRATLTKHDCREIKTSVSKQYVSI